DSKKSSRPNAGNSSSISRRGCCRAACRSSVSMRPTWLSSRRMSGRVRLKSLGGTTRYSDTGCAACWRSARRKSLVLVVRATIGSRYTPRKDIAVDSTPLSSLGDLFNNSRAADATTGWTASPRCRVRIITRRVSVNGRLGSARNAATPARVFSGSAYNTREEGPDEERLGVFRPVVPPVIAAFGVHENIGNILGIADFIIAFAHLQEGVIAGTLRTGGVEVDDVGKLLAPARGEV